MNEENNAEEVNINILECLLIRRGRKNCSRSKI